MAGWLGGLALLLGLLGLWRGRRDPRVQGVALGGLACLVFSLGDRLQLTETLRTEVPLPWVLAGILGGPLAALVAAYRFLSGAAFALAGDINSSSLVP